MTSRRPLAARVVGAARRWAPATLAPAGRHPRVVVPRRLAYVFVSLDGRARGRRLATGDEFGASPQMPRRVNRPTHPRGGAAEVGGSDRVAALTGMRAVAALFVVGTHAAFATGELSRGYLGQVYARLEVGVAIFFVLSGFLLFRPWIRAAAAGSKGPTVARYARRRVRRIMPAYVVTVLLAFVVYSFYSAGPNPGQSWAGLMRHLTLTQIYPVDYFVTSLHLGLSQTWSLAVEVAFYATLPLLAFVLLVLLCRGRWHPRRLLAGLGGLAIISPVWLVVLETTDWLPNSAGMWLPAHVGCFAGGMALATWEVMGVRCRSAMLVPLAMVAFLTVATPIVGGAALGSVRWWQPLTKGVLFAVVAMLVVAPLALCGPGWFARALSTKPMVWLGGISYEIFLLHVLVMAVVFEVVLRWPAFTGSLAGLFAVTLLFTIPLAWALRRLTDPRASLRRRTAPASDAVARAQLGKLTPPVGGSTSPLPRITQGEPK